MRKEILVAVIVLITIILAGIGVFDFTYFILRFVHMPQEIENWIILIFINLLFLSIAVVSISVFLLYISKLKEKPLTQDAPIPLVTGEGIVTQEERYENVK